MPTAHDPPDTHDDHHIEPDIEPDIEEEDLDPTGEPAALDMWPTSTPSWTPSTLPIRPAATSGWVSPKAYASLTRPPDQGINSAADQADEAEA